MARAKYKEGDRVLTTVRTWTVGKIEKTGTKYVRVKLNNYIDWTGYLTKKGMKDAMSGLEAMGFKGASLKQLAEPDALNTEIEVVAVISEVRPYKDKFYYSARWVNKNSAFGFDSKSKGLLDDEFDIDTRAYLDETVEADEPIPAQQAYTEQNNTSFTADDIPF